MARTAQDVLADAARAASGADDNRVVPLIAAGAAPRSVLAAFALEQHHVIAADRVSYRHLAGRSAGAVAAFFTALADGEDTALSLLGPLAAACGLDEAALRAHEPSLPCQAYPACTAWLALQAEPVDVAVALSVNFAAWGGYCGVMGRALRSRYGFADEACGFFDFFAREGGDALLRAAVEEGLGSGGLSERLAWRYGRLLQGYEGMFWEGVGGG
ncbi:transcriptional regulator [Streptomyces sp. AV19]|uniref:transcriptional regulator n=1 Tax=Streptomyces sp. AV19 TaxID=2793068 RepID=UPI0018FE344D|nr:transcriptional regulator [Streptomyces sp. AV19]MBH1938347.1 transcriptional regulator [Streptomyces sp. AV19]MDG4534996.1 transcriptional regulator [Streptomyces sp. AV19]